MTNIFDTPEKIQVGISNFTDLQTHPGWILVKDIITANIETIKEQIIAGGDEDDLNLKRRDLMAYQNVINTPVDQIEKLQGSKSPAPSPDPYDQPKPLEKE